ncbi:class I SAM-dependent methyltransferase [Rosenbergiella collisarenosi]|uniref:class I SAM-dependent methyltransferase n=1 Tax=Rosenbergiella collisarenosi TaxID=1544695 RepID=UPI001F4DBA78|nr:class I SAM-dependent methyltransferase [Rosenbergiella collisarenosi]
MTIEYYQNHADEFYHSTIAVDMSALYTPFLALIPKQGRILDAGCGSGRDTQFFAAHGYQVDAFDASSEMVNRARQLTGLPVKVSTFDAVNVQEQYDGIWCCASLLHVPHQELKQTLDKFIEALKYYGIIYLSFKYGDSEREINGRYFNDMNEGKLRLLCQDFLNVRMQRYWKTEDKRKDRNEIWVNALLQKSGTNQ